MAAWTARPARALAAVLEEAGPHPADVRPADVVPDSVKRHRPAARRGPDWRGGGHEDDLREALGRWPYRLRGRLPIW